VKASYVAETGKLRVVALPPAPMMAPRVAVILLGPPGAGKGTQARRIGEFFRYPRISTGDMLREAVRKDSALGRRARRYIEAGDLVPDALVDAMVRARLRRKDCAQGFVLDGYPRTIHQAEFLGTLFPDSSLRIIAVGIKVPSATPATPSGRTSQTDKARLASAEPTAKMARGRCRAIPCKMLAAGHRLVLNRLAIASSVTSGAAPA